MLIVCAQVTDKNPFDFKNTSHEYKFINWARKFREQKNEVKTQSTLINHQLNKITKIYLIHLIYSVFPIIISHFNTE